MSTTAPDAALPSTQDPRGERVVGGAALDVLIVEPAASCSPIVADSVEVEPVTAAATTNASSEVGSGSAPSATEESQTGDVGTARATGRPTWDLPMLSSHLVRVEPINGTTTEGDVVDCGDGRDDDRDGDDDDGPVSPVVVTSTTSTDAAAIEASDEAQVACSDFFVQFPTSLAESACSASEGDALSSSERGSRRRRFSARISGMFGGGGTSAQTVQRQSSMTTTSSSSTSKLVSECRETTTTVTEDEFRMNRSTSSESADSAPASLGSVSADSSSGCCPVSVVINGREVPELAMILRSDGKCKFRDGRSMKPRSSTLEQLVQRGVVTPGKNLLRYVAHLPPSDSSGDGRIKRRYYVEAHLYLWRSTDSIIITDIDGTVTKSDVRGVVDTILTRSYNHAHSGVCKLFTNLARAYERASNHQHAHHHHPNFHLPGRHHTHGSGEGEQQRGGDRAERSHSSLRSQPPSPQAPVTKVRFLYLTSRPISLLDSTREFLTNLTQDDHRLPPGPVLCHVGSLAEVLFTELVKKNTHEFKADVLSRQVVLPFAAAGRKKNEKLFIAGFGNKSTDAVAYERVGTHRDDIYIINRNSEIVCMSNALALSESRSSSRRSVSSTSTGGINGGGSGDGTAPASREPSLQDVDEALAASTTTSSYWCCTYDVPAYDMETPGVDRLLHSIEEREGSGSISMEQHQQQEQSDRSIRWDPSLDVDGLAGGAGAAPLPNPVDNSTAITAFPRGVERPVPSVAVGTSVTEETPVFPPPDQQRPQSMTRTVSTRRGMLRRGSSTRGHSFSSYDDPMLADVLRVKLLASHRASSIGRLSHRSNNSSSEVVSQSYSYPTEVEAAASVVAANDGSNGEETCPVQHRQDSRVAMEVGQN